MFDTQFHERLEKSIEYLWVHSFFELKFLSNVLVLRSLNETVLQEKLLELKWTPESTKEWQEFYDSTAKAKYWFNTVTGEASWVNPFRQGK